MTLVEICAKYSADDRCRELLERLRWLDGPVCLRCGESVTVRLSPKLLWCGKCSYQFSVTSGTIFHDSHLPLVKWFAAVYLLCESRKGMSANQIKRMLGVSYKTAWYLCHRIRAAMREIESDGLSGTVEIDETYVGGKSKNMHNWKRRQTQGRGSVGKQIVVGLRQRNGNLRFFHVQDIESGTLAKYIKENISAGDVEVIVTDEHKSYPKAINDEPLLGDYRGKHRTVNHSAREYVRGPFHTNTIENSFSLLKRGIMGTWHKISAKHLQAYLHEMTFRFDRRDAGDFFEDTLAYMGRTSPLRFAELIAEKKAA
jgi:transposase-like protein